MTANKLSHEVIFSELKNFLYDTALCKYVYLMLARSSQNAVRGDYAGSQLC